MTVGRGGRDRGSGNVNPSSLPLSHRPAALTTETMSNHGGLTMRMISRRWAIRDCASAAAR